MKIRIIIFVALLIGSTMTKLNAEIKKVAQSGYQFLKIDADARAAAMGGAFILVGTGASSMFYNPAGMTEQPASIDFFSTQTNWLADIGYYSLGVTKKLGNFGVIGFSMQTSDYGSIIGTRVADNTAGFIETGNIEVEALAMGVSFAKSLTDRFSVGGQVKFVSQSLGNTLMPDGAEKSNKTDGLAYDFGTIYYPGIKSFRFGMGVRNFSKNFKYEDDSFPLPLTFTMGVALDVMDFVGSFGENHNLLVEVDAVHPIDYTERVNMGIEYGFKKIFFLRGGYKFNHDTEGLSLGVGFSIRLIGLMTKLSYSFNDAGSFSPVNRISIGISL
ncbi:MAG: PorV/PorQ family protein [Candidatus Neomarinimicrobiota bacterium]|nr:PorV/PorQ family protein [Candidatus Neomarinimicrobiota bacterium]MEE3149810.1 PorV/PorQ family protein [Candidatus Neomarinimicrobiota bacterium]